MPARQTLKGWACDRRACEHDFPEGNVVRLVLHHDHLIDYARDSLRQRQENKRFSETDFSVKWNLILEQLRPIVFKPEWICNHCNEQDGALKAASHAEEDWFLHQYTSLRASQLKALYDIKTRSNLKEMRREAVAMVAARVIEVENGKARIDAILAAI
jgi:hypothetical protein